jgi:hypothetical protein
MRRRVPLLRGKWVAPSGDLRRRLHGFEQSMAFDYSAAMAGKRRFRISFRFSFGRGLTPLMT